MPTNAATPTLTVLATFDGGAGKNPVGPLILDATGDLLGTTLTGSNGGTVFELAKGASSVTKLSDLYGSTFAGVVADSAGNAFGESEGSSSAAGLVYELNKGFSVAHTLTSFNSGAYVGSQLASGLLIDGAGDLFGTTLSDGSAGDGTIFELVHGSYGTVKTLATFTGGSNGAQPTGVLVSDAAGDLFGTTANGGSAGKGTIFELAKGASAVTTLASFTGGNGANPRTGLIIDGAGNLYGTTANGGSAGDGTVFELAQGATAITALANLPSADSNGFYPPSRPIIDAAGNLFFTFPLGGFLELAAGASTVATIPVTTKGATTGNMPYGGLVADANGDLFGTMSNGGTGAGGDPGYGTIFELTNVGFQPFTSGLTPVAPTITGGPSTVPTTYGGPGHPFAGVTVSDGNSGAIDTLTIKFGGGRGGTLSGYGLSGGTGGIYTLSGSATSVTNALDALTFTPTTGPTGTADDTDWLLTDSSSAGAVSTTAVYDAENINVLPTAVTLSTAPLSVGNGKSVVIGTAISGAGPLSAAIQNDPAFGAGSSIVVDQAGNLVYTPGLITTAKAGTDSVTFTVTDGITGAITPGAFAITLDSPAAPVVTPAAATPTAAQGQTAVLGTVTDGDPTNPVTGADPLSVSLVSDNAFGGSVSLDAAEEVVYQPGPITASNAGTDHVTYTVMDDVTLATTTVTAAVTLRNTPSAPRLTQSDHALAGATSVNTPSFTGTATPGATVQLYSSGTPFASGTADGSGNWTIASPHALVAGQKTITATETVGNGPASPASAPLNFTILPPPVAPAAPVLASPHDASGNTTVNDPTVTGVALPNAMVSLYSGGGALIGAVLADPITGQYSITANRALVTGQKSLSVTQTDVYGTASAQSAPLTFILLTPPPAPTVQLTAADRVVDNATSLQTPVFTGTGVAGDTVNLYSIGVFIGSTQVGQDGTYTLAANRPLVPGLKSITATLTDGEGTSGPSSTALAFTLLGPPTPPSTPTVTVLPTSTGATPTFTGTATPGDTVSVFSGGGTLIGTGTADIHGSYTVTSTRALSPGLKSITTTQTDSFGNVSAASVPLSYTETNYSGGAATGTITTTGVDTFNLGSPDLTVIERSLAATVNAGAGALTFIGGAGADLINGASGDIAAIVGSGPFVLNQGTGHSEVSCNAAGQETFNITNGASAGQLILHGFDVSRDMLNFIGFAPGTTVTQQTNGNVLQLSIAGSTKIELASPVAGGNTPPYTFLPAR